MKFIVDNTQRLDVALRVLSSLCGLGQAVTDEAIVGLRAGVNESEATCLLTSLPAELFGGRSIGTDFELRIFQRLHSRPSTIDRPADFTHVQGLPAASPSCSGNDTGSSLLNKIGQ
jgi:hypothetical protein